jgi:hypothetical protein
MTTLMIAAELGQARPDHAMDWNETAWILWWSFTAVATLLFVVGVRSVASRSRIPELFGWLMALASLVFLCVAVAQMLRHAPSWPDLWPIFWAFVLISLITSAATLTLSSRAALVVLVVLGGIGTLLGLGNEWTERAAAATGLTQFGFILFVVVGALGLFAWAKERA